MVRWYSGYHCLGSMIQYTDMVRRCVNQLGMRQSVPLMRVERPRGRQRQFYLFLAIECEGDAEFPVPEGLSSLEQCAGLLPGQLSFPLDQRPAIDRMTESPTEVQEFFDRIPRQESPMATHHSLGDDEIQVLPVLPVPSEDMILAQDRFLAWISAKGSGSWSQFSDACAALGCAEDHQITKRLQRRLRLLGHMESTGDGSWSATPPVLIQVGHQSASEVLFLCGQRTKSMVTRAAGSAEVSVDRQPHGDGPSRVSVLSNDAGEGTFGEMLLDAPVGPVRYVGNISEQLAGKLKSLSEWEASLKRFPYVFNDPDYILGSFNTKKYGEGMFHECAFAEELGLYELSPKQHDTGSRTGNVTGYYSKSTGTWHRGDWYGLRFLSRLRAGDTYFCEYEPMTGTLSIPQDWRWPEVYERALVLSSGYLPDLSGGRLTYQKIDESTLDIIHQKLEVPGRR